MKNKLLKTLLLGLSCSLFLVGCSHIDVEEETETEETTTIAVSGVSLNVNELEIDVYETATLVATISPSNASNQSLSWSSSDNSIATIDNSGLLTALSAGTTVISVTTVDGGYSDTCNVTVNAITSDEVAVTGVSLDNHSLSLAVNETSYLVASISPEDATTTTVKWSSDDTSVATVNSRGKVTGVAAGSANITVTTTDGNYTDTCVVTVSEQDISVTGVSLNYDSATIYVGKTLTLSANIEPSSATNQEVTWSTSDTSVATVKNGTVTGVTTGSADITVKTSDGNYTATCAFTVIEEESEDEEETYVPDESDEYILSITTDTLSSGSLNTDGEYEFDISKDYQQIYVNTPDTAIVLNLQGVTIENDENSPIYVEDCDSIDISAKNGTVNCIKDNRSTYSSDEDGQGHGAIYVKNGDLTLKGKGQLDITGNYLNGVHGKDDVKVKNLTLNITAVNHGIRGNDSVTISSGTIDISCGGDGLHSENSDISSKGNQRGDVTISGGTVTINSWGDAIQAAYDAIIEEADVAVPTELSIATNKYSSYDGETVDTSSSSFYLKMNSSTYSNGNYKYAAYINGSWYPATYKGTLSSGSSTQWGPGGGMGGQSTYYVYQIEKPSSATSFTLYRFNSSVTSYSTSSYNAVSDSKAFNSAYDMVQISVSSGKINFSSWSNYSSGTSDTSCKGIKAENEVYVTGGTISINAYDDGIHANNDGSLENGSTPLGNINISSGTITIASADDGIHADYTLTISGGTINVTTAYEGLEGNLIRISGGSTYVYATDDGVNAGSGKASTPNITVSGGLLDVTVPSSGDTDGIDSNGTYTQSGGVVIVKGPGSANGQTMGAAALDTDSTVKITSGTLIVFGGIEQTPSSSVTKTLCSSSTVSTGSHTITFSSTSYSTTLKYSTSGCVVYSSLGSATLK